MSLEDLKLAIAELQGGTHEHEDSTPEPLRGGAVKEEEEEGAVPSVRRRRGGGAAAAVSRYGLTLHAVRHCALSGG